MRWTLDDMRLPGDPGLAPGTAGPRRVAATVVCRNPGCSHEFDAEVEIYLGAAVPLNPDACPRCGEQALEIIYP